MEIDSVPSLFYERIVEGGVVVTLDTTIAPRLLDTSSESSSSDRPFRRAGSLGDDEETSLFDAVFLNVAPTYAVSATASCHATANAGAPHGKPALSAAIVNTVAPLCFLSGAKVYQQRPYKNGVHVHSFAIAESGLYATTILLFRQQDARALMDYWHKHTNRRTPQDSPPRRPRASSADRSPSPGLVVNVQRSSQLYRPYAMCLVSRQPMFTLMKHILCANIPRFLEATSLSNVMIDIVAQCQRIPLPPRGVVGLSFSMCGMPLKIRPQAPGDLPNIDIPLRHLFQTMGSENMLLIISSLLLERKTLFFAQDTAVLTPMIEACLSLIYPFKWLHVYIPVLPANMRHCIEVPWPIVAGMSSEYLRETINLTRQQQEDNEDTDPPVIIDLDKGRVRLPSDGLAKLPQLAITRFKLMLEDIDISFMLCTYGAATINAETDQDLLSNHDARVDRKLRLLMLDLMKNLFGKVFKFMLDTNRSGQKVFDVDRFLDSQPEEDLPFYSAFFQTSAFITFKRSREANMDTPSVFEQFLSWNESDGTFPVETSCIYMPINIGVRTVSDDLADIVGSQPSLFRVSSSQSLVSTGSGDSGADYELHQAARKALHPVAKAGAANVSRKSFKLSLKVSPPLIRRNRSRSVSDMGDRAAAADRPPSRTSFRSRTPDVAGNRRPRAPSRHSHGSHSFLDAVATYHAEGRGIAADAVATLDRLVSSSERQPTVPSYLYLRAAFKCATGRVLEALADCDLIAKLDHAAFPHSLVERILDDLDASARRSLSDAAFVRTSRTWRRLLEMSAARQAAQQAGGRQDEDDEGASRIFPDVGSNTSVLSAVADMTEIRGDDFITLARILNICQDSGAARNLFQSLRMVDEQELPNAISVEVFHTFLETWRSLNADHNFSIGSGVMLGRKESVLKIKHMVRVSDMGFGTLILTHDQLLLKRSKETLQVCRLKDIESLAKIQFKVVIPPGVPAIRLSVRTAAETVTPSNDSSLESAGSARGKSPTSGEGSRSSSRRSQKKRTLKREDKLEKITLIFFSDRDIWFRFIQEMQLAHQTAQAIGDPSAVQSAAESIELFDVLSKVTGSQSFPSQSRPAADGDGSDGGSESDDDMLDTSLTSPAALNMLSFSAGKAATPFRRRSITMAGSEPGTPHVLQPTEDASVISIDLCGDMFDKPGVQSILAVTDQGTPTLWCGMTDGTVIVCDTDPLIVRTRLLIHQEAVNCMLLSDRIVWSCGADSLVVLTDTESKSPLAEIELDNHVPLSICETKNGVLIGTVTGSILVFDRTDLSIERELRIDGGDECSVRRIDSMLFHGPNIWVACATAVVVIDAQRFGIFPPSEDPIRRVLSTMFEEQEEQNKLGSAHSSARSSRAASPPAPATQRSSATSDTVPAILITSAEEDANDITSAPSAASPELTASNSAIGTTNSDAGHVGGDSRPNSMGEEELTSDSESETSQAQMSIVHPRHVLVTQAANLLCLAGLHNEVWCASRSVGAIHIFDARSYQTARMGGTWSLDTGGFNALATCNSNLVAAGRDGCLYVFELESHSLVREIHSHSGSASALCVVAEARSAPGMIVSGGGVNDGWLVARSEL